MKPQNPQAFPGERFEFEVCGETTTGEEVGNFVSNGHHNGMSLRDYFAAKAMATLVRNWLEGDLISGESVRARLAAASYATADAMLAEREKQTS